MKRLLHSRTLATGLAMFSMFFGAGNVIFPLVIGQAAQDQTPLAILGLLITAVAMPFAGLIAMVLYDGDYRRFFSRIGVVPGLTLAAIIMALIGPFGGMPRCVSLAYSTFKLNHPGLTLPLFSAASCVLIYFCTFRQGQVLKILGAVLTPLLLLSLAGIVVMGLWNAPQPAVATLGNFEAFRHGLLEGYNTMDLLAAFFFSSVVLVGLRREGVADSQGLLRQTLKGACVGAGLLALTYIGFAQIAAAYAPQLAEVSKDQLLGVVTLHVLGPYAGFAACSAIALACLTTAIALAAVFSEFLQNFVCRGRIGYRQALVITLAFTWLVSTLEFTAIVAILAPVLQIAYPALIALTLLNIWYHFQEQQALKWPFYAAFAGSVAAHLA